MNTLGSIWRKYKREYEPASISSSSGLASVGDTDTVKSATEVCFIARQPILDRAQAVFGYELLARSGWENRFTGDSDDATRKMIADGALYGFDGLTLGKPAFVNCTRESLVEGMVTLLPKLAVLEILETIVPDKAVVDACTTVKKLGYQIALDDFRIAPNMEELAMMADYVKVDFRLSAAKERHEILACLKGTRARLVAEKVETEEEFRIASGEGFELFQGYFFCHPTVFTVRRPPSSGANFFRLFTALHQKDYDIQRMAEMLKADPAICYQLLRLVNTAAFGTSRSVQSVEEALMLAGEEQVKKLILNAIAIEAGQGHPRELLIRALHRARFLELMSAYTGQSAQEQYLFGLLSLMHVLLGMPLATLVRDLPLRQEVKEALEGRSNKVALALDLLGSYEEGDWLACTKLSRAMKLSDEKLTEIYTASLQWADETATPGEPQAH